VMYFYMDTTKMFKTPQISNETRINLGQKIGLDLINRKINSTGEVHLFIKDGVKVVDGTTSYNDKEYTDIINKFKGKVLLLGLGFGRSVIEACYNTKVKEVTVVERNPKVIKLFWELYGQKFKGVKKLSIIEEDADNYKEKGFDHVFIDIFCPPLDKRIYRLVMNKLRERFKGSIVHYIDLY